MTDGTRNDIANEAFGLVYGPRQASYGHPDADFTATGRITAAILTRWMQSEGLVLYSRGSGGPFDLHGPIDLPDIPPETMALVIASVKISRESGQHKRDNLVDLIGYALCAQRIHDRDWEDPLTGEEDGREEVDEIFLDSPGQLGLWDSAGIPLEPIWEGYAD